jgi:hypothetical protein
LATENIRIKYDVDKKELASANKELEDFNKTNGITQKEVDQTNKKFKDQDKELNSLNGTMKKVGATIIAAFAADQILDFAKGVVDVTGKFQKMEAVLTNTLGSSSRAQKSLREIQQFAATTPFSVSQLTDSFIKLANQGFVPTQKELGKLGDLAASTGKDFDQLAEAIIDAQVGEFERLKEFGVRSQKEGDKVRFTFKGVEEQVDFTSDAIQEYILGLGDVVGVSGSMNAISGTVVGKISNIGDSFEALQLKIGNESEGLIFSLLNLTSTFLDTANSLVESGISGYIDGIFNSDDIDEANMAVKEFMSSISSQEPIERQKSFNAELERLANLYEEQIKIFESGEISRFQMAENRLNIDRQINALKEEEINILAALDEQEQQILKNEQKKASEEAARQASIDARIAKENEEYEKQAIKDAEKLARQFDDLDELFEKEGEISNAKLERLEEGLQTELDLKFTKDQAELEEELRINELKKQSAQELANFKIAQEERIFNSLISLFGRGTKLGKTVALIQIAQDTAKAISSLTAASEGNPANAFTFGAAGVAQFIVGIARISANIAQAKSVLSGAPKFEKGGKIGGSLHSNGGTLIEAERDEFVMSRKATSKYGFDLMGKINNLELHPDILNGSSGGSSINVLDTKPIADQLKKMPVNITEIDENGFNLRQIRNNQISIKKINRYST